MWILCILLPILGFYVGLILGGWLGREATINAQLEDRYRKHQGDDWYE